MKKKTASYEIKKLYRNYKATDAFPMSLRSFARQLAADGDDVACSWFRNKGVNL